MNESNYARMKVWLKQERRLTEQPGAGEGEQEQAVEDKCERQLSAADQRDGQRTSRAGSIIRA
jgi:hypothetical protein